MLLKLISEMTTPLGSKLCWNVPLQNVFFLDHIYLNIS